MEALADTTLLDAYRPPAGSFDEMYVAPGLVREHWRYLAGSLEKLGPDGLEGREREAKRLIRDNGVTYNIYGDPQGMSRPWELDLVPLLIGSEEWAGIERGLMQRAELLDLLLADLYGPRTVLRDGVLPPELVYSHAGYLRPCYGTRMPGRRHLILYAADLARSPGGGMLVIGDRAQAPSGAGYALENRIVLSRVLPSLFRDSQVHRLALFFRTVRATLTSLAPRAEDSPRIVMLTPGARNEAYFEHAYLANYLGYTLVEGSDLSVRDGRVWLRSLDGPQPVDVILRRVDDEWCDPLDLRADSILGVPGLVQTARSQQVAVANPLGSSILDHPALMAYTAALGRHFLDEEVALASVDTWWCGDPVAREHVLAHMERLVIKPVRPNGGPRCLFGGELDAGQREVLRASIRATPHLYVGQEPVPLSSTPVLVNGGLEPRHVVLRSFLVSREDAYVVMPGGLTRVSPRAGSLVVSNQLGGIGKDTWVLASEPERQETLVLGIDRRVGGARLGREVPSRVADNLFWIGRYAERAEDMVRLLRTVVLYITEQPMPGEGADCLHTLLRAVTHQTHTYPGFVGEGAAERLAVPDTELLAIVSQQGRLGGLLQTLQALAQAAWSVRDRLSTDTWRVVGDIEEELESLRRNPPKHLYDALEELDALVTGLVAFAGLTTENVIHNQGWLFLEIGRRLERAANTASLLRSTLVPVLAEAQEAAVVESVLGVTDSLIAYRRQQQAGRRMEVLLELVLLDEDNPRALVYQLARLEELVGRLPRERSTPHRSPEERFVLEALTNVRLAAVEDLTGTPDSAIRAELDQLLARISHLLSSVSDAVSAAYFPVEVPVQQLVNLRRQ